MQASNKQTSFFSNENFEKILNSGKIKKVTKSKTKETFKDLARKNNKRLIQY